jgi:hypothetical protein
LSVTRTERSLLAALRNIADTCQANMDYSDKVRAAHYSGERSAGAQRMYDRVKRSTERARAAIARATGEKGAA